MERSGRLAVLISVLAIAAFGLAACGSDDEGTTASTATEETSTTEDATTTTADTGGAEGDAAAGETVWVDNGCGNCHTMAAADSNGTTGPNLDDLQPDFEQVVAQVTSGGGVMPAFGETLSEQQINDVAAYVVKSTSG